MSDVRFPEMRSEVIGAVHALADRDYQRRVWVEQEYPNAGYFDDLTLNVNILYDDTKVLEDPSSTIGTCLRTTDEAEAMRLLAEALDAVFEEKGMDLSDAEYIADPRWDAVVEAAGAALRVLHPPDDEEE